jgi:hypothetical protein
VKHRLRTTIIAGLVPTSATGLRGMSGVNLDHADTACLGFVRDERVQLGKAPTMQAPFDTALRTRLLATPQLGGVADAVEIFKHDGSPWGRMLHHAFREDVIVISTSPKLFAAQLFEVTFCRAAAFGLQLAFQTEGTLFLFLPVLLSQELTSRSDCWPVQTQVNPDHLLRWDNGGLRDGYHDMERVTPFAITQISTTHAIADILLKVSRYRERQFNPPIHCSETTGHAVPLDPVRTLVIADSRHLTVRTTNRLKWWYGLALLLRFLNLLWVCLFLLDLPGDSRFDGFCGLDTGRTYQLGRKIRILSSQRIVRAFVQLDPIATRRGKALVGHSIKAGCVLLKRCLEASRLRWRWVQLDGNRSIHAESMSYITLYCQHAGTIAPVPQPQERSGASLPMHECRGLSRRFR